jgi:hypothetical protein
MESTDAAAHGHGDNETVAHEHSDVNIRAILMFAAGLVVVAVVVHILMWLLFGILEKEAAKNDPAVSPLAAPDTQMPRTTTASPFFGGAPGPQLVTDEPKLLQMLRTQENQQLHSYGWVDQQNGVARVPIEEAKKLLLQRGLPVRSTEGVDTRLGTNAPALGESSSGRAIPVPKSQPAHGGTSNEQQQTPGPEGQHIGAEPQKKPGT